VLVCEPHHGQGHLRTSLAAESKAKTGIRFDPSYRSGREVIDTGGVAPSGAAQIDSGRPLSTNARFCHRFVSRGLQRPWGGHD
jgi:hypothetical protein